ncbi:hypothetical protein DPEC_G00378660 [Dallia pectoralis]|nr:hypothetical protein DPEC_G00378660 [Dallia pectoralis]
MSRQAMWSVGVCLGRGIYVFLHNTTIPSRHHIILIDKSSSQEMCAVVQLLSRWHGRGLLRGCIALGTQAASQQWKRHAEPETPISPCMPLTIDLQSWLS